MDNKKLIKKLGFFPKENTSGVFSKQYADNCTIDVDFVNEVIDFGPKIKGESKTTQNFSQTENWVVLECVNRLLEKGYKPENIILEKTYPSGHGHSGRLDICVTRNNGSEYMLIECKTYGPEFNKALKELHKKGGQLFTYFKFSNKADVILLYASDLKGGEIVYQNEIVKIEEEYRAGDVHDFYEKWNKLTKDNGIFESWVIPYDFVSKALTPNLLEPIKADDSSFIFNRFLEILRHNVVSDKPNAFNKIFNLFLCKVYDEKSTHKNEELKFQWLEGIDTHVTFQLRLSDLYKSGMKEFLEKEVSDFSKDDFDKKYKHLDESDKKELLEDIFKLRLQKNNEFAIKEVYDDKSFEENAKVVKEVVELLQKYRIRYNKRQQYLSDFFELLLTTGLKQESGQFFTPVPIARFIIKSLPLPEIIDEKLAKGERNNLLPHIMDYAAGSGHFLTESMHEIQRILDERDSKDYIPDTGKKITTWQNEHFDWATKYVYGIEKDYRLVKVGKVGCYLHGDGLANVILSDGLANFKNDEYKGILKQRDKDFPQENKKFDIVISNPPYSVSSFKNTARDYYRENDFELYKYLTDNSSEIECLFIERTKQLLKDGGIAGIILPSSILSNTGIYTKAREIIFDYFDIIAITEFGSNTFMATGTNTVTLFLRRKNNYEPFNIKTAVNKFFTNLRDVTINGIENPVAKYLDYVWESITLEDYKSLLQKIPVGAIEQHEIFKEYRKKLKAKNDQEFWDKLFTVEQEKIYYFIKALPQKTILVKTGSKAAEKKFLGYEFSHRRGSEGIHAIQRGKEIEECTSLFDEDVFDNPEKASTYIYKAFKGEMDNTIPDTLSKNLSRLNLVDMLSFDRADFDKSISLSVKKKVTIESKWEKKLLSSLIKKVEGDTTKIPKYEIKDKGKFPVITQDDLLLISGYSDNEKTVNDLPVIVFGDHSCNFKYIDFEFLRGADGTVLLKTNELVLTKYLYFFLSIFGRKLIQNSEKYERHFKYLKNIKIPLPPKEIQKKIVGEIEDLEKKYEKDIKLASTLESEPRKIYFNSKNNFLSVILSNEIKIIGGGTPKTNIPEFWNGDIPWLSIVDFKNTKRFVDKTEKKITEKGLKNSSTKYLEKGDTIISARGTVGALAQLKKPMTFNQSCYGIKAKENLLPSYLYFALKFEIEQFKDNTYGAIFDTITIKTFDKIKIPLPPLSEQEKIVSKIEGIEEKINSLDKELQTIPQQKEEILKKFL